MKILLTDDVVGVGDIGETVVVKAGYARNFLIPKGLAIEAQSASAGEVRHRMRQIDAKKNRLKAGASAKADQISKANIVLTLRVGKGGKVFGSVGAKDIAVQLGELGFEIDRRRVLMSEPIKKIGEHVVRVKLHKEVITEVNVRVDAAEASEAEQQAEIVEAQKAVEAAAEQKQGKEDWEDADSEDLGADEDT